MKTYFEEPEGKIIQGDVLECLKALPDESVDMVITSPPYYGLRNYGVDGQIGLEETFDEFLNKMMTIFAEVKRVLKKEGTFWLNFGDCYGGSGGGGYSNKSTLQGYTGENTKGRIMAKSFVYSTDNSRMFGGEENDSQLKQTTGSMEGILKAKRLTYWGGNVEKSTLTNPERQQEMGRSGNQKCMLMQPERLAIKMIDELGFILRNKIKWAKQVLIKKENRTIGSVMPTSVKDRFNESGEELYFFVKNKKYYFNLDAVRLKQQTFEDRDMGVDRQREYPDSKYNKFNYRVPDAVKKQGQPQFKASEEEIKNYKKDWKAEETEGYKMGSVDSHRAALRGGLKSLAQRNKVNDPRGNHEGGPGSWRDFKDENNNTENMRGKNLPTIWQIGSEPHNFQRELNVDTDHFAIFPQALVEIPIKCGCPENGIVLDIFGGSGTVGLVAKKFKRKYLLIELNSKYCEIAKKRIQQIQPKLF